MADRVVRKYRQRSDAEKRAILAACDAPGASVSRVSRQFDCNANQIYLWRKRFGVASGSPAAPTWLPVVVPEIPSEPSAASADSGRIDVVLSTGHRLELSGRVDPATLETCLRLLSR